MKNRALILGAILAAMHLLPARAAPTVITVLSFVDPAKKGPRDLAFRQIIDKFQAENPDIRVQVEPNPFAEIGVKFLMAHAASRATDVTFINAANVGSLINAGALSDLQSLYLNGWSKEQEADNSIRSAWDAALVDGKRYGVPIFVSAPVIYYRKDLFKAAGIDPGSLKTWDAFTEASKKLTTDDAGGKSVGGVGTPLNPEHTGSVTAMGTMLLGGQKQVWDPVTCKASYATDTGVKAIDLQVGWMNRDKVMPREMMVDNSDAVIESFEAGRLAMAMAPFARLEQTKQEATFDKSQIGIMSWPNWTAGVPGPGWVSGWWLGVWSKTKHPKEAAKFVEFATSPVADRIWALVGGQVPLHSSVIADPAFAGPEFSEVQDVVRDWKLSSFTTPAKCNMGSYISDLNTAFQEVAFGRSDTLTALRNAEQQFNSHQ